MLYILDPYNEKLVPSEWLEWRVGDPPRVISGFRNQTVEFRADGDELTWLLSALRITRAYPEGASLISKAFMPAAGTAARVSAWHGSPAPEFPTAAPPTAALPGRLATKAKMRVSFVLTLDPDDIDLTPRQVEKAVNGILSALAGLNLVYDAEPCQVIDAGPYTEQS